MFVKLKDKSTKCIYSRFSWFSCVQGGVRFHRANYSKCERVCIGWAEEIVSYVSQLIVKQDLIIWLWGAMDVYYTVFQESLVTTLLQTETNVAASGCILVRGKVRFGLMNLLVTNLKALRFLLILLVLAKC